MGTIAFCALDIVALHDGAGVHQWDMSLYKYSRRLWVRNFILLVKVQDSKLTQ